jgi:hypothetical protein
MQLVKTVASAGPETKPRAGRELKVVFDQPRSGSTAPWQKVQADLSSA